MWACPITLWCVCCGWGGQPSVMHRCWAAARSAGVAVELRGFPHMAEADRQRKLAMHRQDWLAGQTLAAGSADHRRYWVDRSDAQRAHVRAWESLAAARDTRLPADWRWNHVRRLRVLLGDEAWAARRMPGPWPDAGE